MRIGLVLTFLLILFTSLPSYPENSAISKPPSTIRLKMPPPKSYEEALNRIPDFIILNTILPPVIDREKLMTQIFGKYTPNVKKVLTDDKVRELTSFTALKLKDSKLKLPQLKKLILEKLKITPKDKHLNFSLIPIAVALAVALVLLALKFLI